MSNIKNYSLQGGEKWVVEGKLELAKDGRLLFNGQELKPAAGQADSEASSVATLKNDFNALLQKLFNAGLMVTDKSELMAAIAEVLGLLEGAVVGYGIGEYYEDDYDTFQGAISAAREVAEEPEASQNEIAAALGTLASAKATFESAASTVDKTILVAVIADAQDLLDAAEVGEEPGQYPEVAYNAFEMAIEEAQDVVDDKSATQSAVDTAVSNLETAIATFETAVNPEA